MVWSGRKAGAAHVDWQTGGWGFKHRSASLQDTGHSCRKVAWLPVINILFHRIQGRIGSPVSSPHTGASRTVRRYPAANTQLTSNALPSGNGHEQSNPGPHTAYQEHTLSPWGKTFWTASISEGPPWEGVTMAAFADDTKVRGVANAQAAQIICLAPGREWRGCRRYTGIQL